MYRRRKSLQERQKRNKAGMFFCKFARCEQAPGDEQEKEIAAGAAEAE